MSAQTRVASKQRLGNDVKMAEKPDIIVSIDLGTTYTGKNSCYNSIIRVGTNNGIEVLHG